MIEVIEDSALKEISAVGHGFFTRRGGVSSGLYSALNCAYASKDDLEAVRHNRAMAMQQWGMGFNALVSTRNVHSARVVVVSKPWSFENRPDADAVVTREHSIVLGSDSADCPIVLLCDALSGVIGLAHAGWKGAKKGVLAQTVEQMVFLGAQRSNICAAIGPCISQESYEVGPEFYSEFIDANPMNQSYFDPAVRLDYYQFDLRGYVKDQLLGLNLKTVSAVEVDTYADEERFFSCRRAFHRGDSDFGGHLSCIYLKDKSA